MKNNARRIVARSGRPQVRRLGFDRSFGTDYFHRILNMPNHLTILMVVGLIMISNLFFALLYWVCGNPIENANSFMDVFFFSVQTMATVGYGYMHPVGTIGNLLATVEAFFGLLAFAIAAGLIFAKLSRPTAKVIFSNHAVVTKRNGAPYLMFRMVNERRNQILEANLSLTFNSVETTLEGETIRTFKDMALLRSRTPIFAATWTALHPLDEKSPLVGPTQEQLREREIELIVTFNGIDDTFSQSVMTRHSYVLDEIKWNYRFNDILSRDESGTLIVDFRQFHQSQPN